MKDSGQLNFFNKLDEPNEYSPATPMGGGSFFSGLIDRVFRTETPSSSSIPRVSSVPSTNVESAISNSIVSNLPAPSNANFNGSFQRKNPGKVDAKVELKNYNDSSFKQYWMPDATGKECYQCEERFTTFRRRHHCRLCGQIFCSKCCNNRVDGSSLGYLGELRLCDFCATKVQQKSNEPSILQGRKNSQQTILSRKLSDQSKVMNSDTVKTVSNGTIWSICPGTSIDSPEDPPIQNKIQVNDYSPSILSVHELCAGSHISGGLQLNETMTSLISEEDESGPDCFVSNFVFRISDSSDMFAYANMATTNTVKDVLASQEVESGRKITYPKMSTEEKNLEINTENNLKEIFLKNTEKILDDILFREDIDSQRWKTIIFKNS
ncbi:unnamed protein product [Caenorhabditis auriculariae]|uniref:FYVE-type domain-containing protein n=1 Tax=Caenorhabditis auriculariae TaxID=2777116 RepID=A0A8S1H6W4_9PELO|nr:unnamed protein product [Caenorhabditis auriculariae]